MPNELQVADVLDGRFEITHVVARSGMASIYKARDLSSGQSVAVKVPFMQFESDPAFYSRFQREEEIGKLLNHPYIIRIVPVENKSRPYIVMEFLEGETLGKRLKREGKLRPEEALQIANKACEALSYMHSRPEKVIHRDLKPDNIMLCADGSIRIMDFGIAKAGLRRITFTGFSAALGTPDYMAPEQVKGQRGDERTDIYSLGAILYETLTGKVPFDGDNPHAVMNSRLIGDPVAPRQINPDLSPQIEELVLHAMERQPAARYPSVAAMSAELKAPQSIQLTGRCDRLHAPELWQLRWRAWRTTVCAVLVPLIVVLLFLLIFRKH
ncbi:MAG TPA: serine/threonine-protein kinase [Planctomycetota bacterium]|jgi:serine/threonine-protein kinase